MQVYRCIIIFFPSEVNLYAIAVQKFAWWFNKKAVTGDVVKEEEMRAEHKALYKGTRETSSGLQCSLTALSPTSLLFPQSTMAAAQTKHLSILPKGWVSHLSFIIINSFVRMFISYKVLYVDSWGTYVAVGMDNLIPSRK